jgi:phenylalanyl-tRNA synthetase beta chain
MKVSKIPLDADMIQGVTGLSLSEEQLTSCIRKSRLGVRGKAVLVPRYRIDILHPVDIAEEVALGYGIDRIEPEYPPSKRPGALNPTEQFFGEAATVMAGLGMIELMTYELVDERSLYVNFGRQAAATKITVEDPKSIDHSLLRDSLVPCLLSALSSNVKEEYPQRVFEIGRIYQRTDSGVTEAWHLACLSAHAQASYSEARMYLDSFCRTMTGLDSATIAREHWAFAPGRSAGASIGGRHLGVVGEIKPEALAASGINVPVCAFEIDLSALSKQLK